MKKAAKSPKGKSPKLGEMLGRNIARERKAKGLTQQELAESIGIDPVSLSRIETGATVPSLQRLAVIASALDVGLVTLVSSTGNHLSDQAQEIATSLKHLNGNDRRLIIDMVKQFAKRLSEK